MATDVLPHYKLKQNLLHGKDVKAEERKRWGQEFLKAGWLYDAIEFLTAANDAEGLSQVRFQVVDEGNVFLFRKIMKALGATASEIEWKQIGDRAFALGKLQYAREAYRMASFRKGLDQVDELLKPPPSDPATEESQPSQAQQ